jgi:SanA protein
MFKKVFKVLIRMVGMAILCGAIVLILPRLITTVYARSHLSTTEETEVKQVAIVFGAGLRRDGRPTAVLRDRVEAAAELYFAGKVEVLLMSGDNRYVDYDEPTAMRDYAMSLGVPEDAIVRDFAGRRTYDTCYRAKEIFGVKEAILVTQKFHQPRALYLCHALGIPAIGVAVPEDHYRRRSLVFWNLRELPATLTALWDLYIAKPLPVLGEPEPIFPTEEL